MGSEAERAVSTQAKRAGTGSAAGGGTMQASGQVARLKAGDAQAQGVRLLLLLEVGEESDEARSVSALSVRRQRSIAASVRSASATSEAKSSRKAGGAAQGRRCGARPQARRRRKDSHHVK